MTHQPRFESGVVQRVITDAKVASRQGKPMRISSADAEEIALNPFLSSLFVIAYQSLDDRHAKALIRSCLAELIDAHRAASDEELAELEDELEQIGVDIDDTRKAIARFDSRVSVPEKSTYAVGGASLLAIVGEGVELAALVKAKSAAVALTSSVLATSFAAPVALLGMASVTIWCIARRRRRLEAELTAQEDEAKLRRSEVRERRRAAKARCKEVEPLQKLLEKLDK